MDSITELNNKNSNKNTFKTKNSAVSFTQQSVQLSDSPFFFPTGYESIFLTLYAIFLPYLTGLLFLLIFVAKGDLNIFSALNNESSFIFNWCIGYECLAAIALLMIMKSAIMFSSKNLKDKPKEFKRP